MPPNVRSFAGFISSLPFLYSVIFIVRLKNFQAMPSGLGMSFSLQWCFRDCGCGKVMSSGDFFRKDRSNERRQRTAANKNSRHGDPMNPSERIDQLIAKLTDWRGKTLASVRRTILEAQADIIEEWKWMGSPVWSRDGIIAVATVLKDKVKVTFSHGAMLPDPDKVFNAGLGGNAWRAIDVFEGDKINDRALKNLVRAAIDYNQIKLKKKAPAGIRAKAHKSKKC